MKNDIIQYQVKQVYGKDTLYVVSEQGKAIQALTGQKTLTEKATRALESLGYSFVQVL